MNNDQVTKAETTEILRLAEQCLGVEGDFVELGCYKGDTSVLLGKLLQKSAPKSPNSTNLWKTCAKPVENSPNSVQKSQKSVDKPWKTLWIYDSFAGLPSKTREDISGAGQNFQKGELLVTKREVINKIRRAGLHNIIIKKAWFNELTDTDLPAKIALAFLDGDLYSSIKTSLQLVTPRLQKSGIMIVHDYNNPELPGSSRAVDEFLRAHPEFQLQQKHTLAILTHKC